LSSTRRTPPARTSRRPGSSRARSPRRRRLPLSAKLVFACAILVIAVLAWAAIARAVAPRANTNRATFDAIIILGTPADSDGNPTPELQDRITEGVHEYQRGVAPRLIVTGGPAHNNFIEADVMARVAHAQGVPESRILEEPHALDTIQNACYTNRILAAHDWHSAEIISSASHLPRAAMIFTHLPGTPLQWRLHAAPDNLTPGGYSTAASLVEVLKTSRYLLWARWTETCNP
jgi:uncharacterized SAM-binding protein YcdF (DUF218 family)